MTKQKFTINEKLPGHNQYVRECKRSPYAGGKMKGEIEDIIWGYIKEAGIKPMDGKTFIEFTWYEKKEKSIKQERDLDNICFAKKFILDAIVKARVLPDDRRSYISGFIDKFVTDADCTKVEVVINSVK